MIVALISLIALAVDLGFYSAAYNRTQTTTDRAALSGLEQWMLQQSINPNLENLQTNVGGDISAIMNQNRYFTSQTANIAWFTGSDNPQPPFYRIEPGRYFPRGAQAELNNLLISQNNNRFICDRNEVPTFCGLNAAIINEQASVDRREVSSIRITGQPYQPLINRFARIFGFGDLPVNVTSIASVVPPELYFVIDISGSSVEETHIRRAEPGIPISEFVFMLQAGNRDFRPDVHDQIYNNLDTNRNGQPTDPRVHFQSDYVQGAQVATNLNDLYQNNTFNPPIHREFQVGNIDPRTIGYSNEQYLGELLVRDVSITPYEGPEPLKTVLAALEDLVGQMGRVNVAGNRIGILFFDSGRLRAQGEEFVPVENGNLQNRAPFGWSRIFRSMSFEEANRVLIAPTSNLLGLGGISNWNTDHTNRLLRYGIFPSFNGFTDATWGLMQAFFELNRSRERGFITNQRIVFLSSDGIANCSRGPLFQAQLTEFPITEDLLTMLTNGFRCNSLNINYYIESMLDIQEFARFLSGQHTLTPQNIALDVILMGDDIGPNLIDPTGCNDPNRITSRATQEWARRERLPITSGFTEGCERGINNDCANAYRNRSPSNPFRMPNIDWMTAAWLTGGNYYPIVPQGTRRNCWNGGNAFGTPQQQLQNIMTELLGSSVSYQLVR